jgi:hypothetical protein
VSARLRAILLLVTALVLTAAASAHATTALRARPAVNAPVVRTVLAEDVDPTGAAGRTLGLSRVTVAPGAALALHRHPGTQIASIERGTLTYWVVREASRSSAAPQSSARSARASAGRSRPATGSSSAPARSTAPPTAAERRS